MIRSCSQLTRQINFACRHIEKKRHSAAIIHFNSSPLFHSSAIFSSEQSDRLELDSYLSHLSQKYGTKPVLTNEACSILYTMANEAKDEASKALEIILQKENVEQKHQILVKIVKSLESSFLDKASVPELVSLFQILLI